jgi:transcriptional regulator with XRE-family HTH domain
VGAILRHLLQGPHRPVAFQLVTKETQTDEPITAALKPLMREQGLTFRALAELTQAHDAGGRGVTFAYLCALTSGREYPSRRSLELIAASLEIDPDYFPEYRLAELRDQLNGREVGFQAAWRRYLELAR